MDHRKAMIDEITDVVRVYNIKEPPDLYKIFPYIVGVHAGHIETGRESDTRLLVTAIPPKLRRPVAQFISGLELLTATVREQSGEKSKD